MTPTTFGSGFKRILIPYKPHENKRLHSDEIPSRSSHWWKGCAGNHAGLRTFGGESCCEPKPQELALYILLTMKAFRNLNFGYFCKKQKKEALLPSIFMDSVIFHSCSRSNSGINRLFSVDFAITHNAHTGLCIDPADPPCHFFLMCSCAISPLNTTAMISYLLESVTSLKRLIPILIKKTVITVILEIQLFFFKKTQQNNQPTKSPTTSSFSPSILIKLKNSAGKF